MTELRDRLLAFLRGHQVVTVAVTADDDCPWAAALFYAVDNDLRLYVLTDPTTRHGRAMQANARVAGAIQRDRQQWREIEGVQFSGRCRALLGTERTHGWSVYCARFGFLQDPDAVMKRQLQETVLWQIEPTWIRLIDNRLGFGHKEEWTRD